MGSVETSLISEQGLPLDRPERIVTTLLVGKLVGDGSGERLCRVRNISSSGMAVETDRPLPYGSLVSVELRSGERLQGRAVWSSAGRAGVAFPEPIDVERILAEAKANRSARVRSILRKAHSPRSPRFEVHCPARIINFGQAHDVIVENISQSGVMIQCPEQIELDTQIVLTIGGLGSRRGTIRWRRCTAVGFSFIEIIPYHELAGWLGHLGTSN